MANGEMAPEGVVCPYCGERLEMPFRGHDWSRCRGCGTDVNVSAQLAFLRARRLFHQAQRAHGVPFVRMHHAAGREGDVLRIMQQAYSGLQEAVVHDLPDEQRVQAVEMMAEITRLLARHGQVSVMEVGYWTRVLSLREARQEYAAVEAALDAGRGPGLGGRLAWWRLRYREVRLRAALETLERQIHGLEEGIGFPERPHLDLHERARWQRRDA
ncbi:MAG: hypothetical protein GX649_17575 [Chloroflexi bacterium]|nr:hypothetical protein [Chloroflexota bacterium]